MKPWEYFKIPEVDWKLFQSMQKEYDRRQEEASAATVVLRLACHAYDMGQEREGTYPSFMGSIFRHFEHVSRLNASVKEASEALDKKFPNHNSWRSFDPIGYGS